MKQLIAKLNRLGVGIDVGWRVFDRDGLADDIYWGNTRDASTLALLIEDARKHGHEFVLNESAEAMLAPRTDGEGTGGTIDHAIQIESDEPGNILFVRSREDGGLWIGIEIDPNFSMPPGEVLSLIAVNLDPRAANVLRSTLTAARTDGEG